MFEFTNALPYTVKDFKTQKDMQFFLVLNPVECDNFDHMIGKEVRINGAQYKVTGVESFRPITIRKDAKIGLGVEEIK